MIGRWNPHVGFMQGRVTEVSHVRTWTRSDRFQVAEVVIDGARGFSFVGREPEELLFRRSRRRAVDRDDVAGLKIGDYVSFSYYDQADAGSLRGLVTGLTVNPDWAPKGDVQDLQDSILKV